MSYNIYQPDNLETMFFRTFKIKPYVYDNSFSLYEQIGQVLHHVNDIIKETNDMGESIVQFETYVLNELKDYDQKIVQEVLRVINEKIEDGTLSELLESLFQNVNFEISEINNRISTIEQDINELNYKQGSVTITIAPSQLLYNVGESINGIVINSAIVKGSNSPTEIKLYKNNVLIFTKSANVDLVETHFDGSIITSDSEYYVTVNDGKTIITSNKINIKFVNNYFYGVASSTDILNSSFIKSLSKVKNVKQNLTQEFVCNNQKIIFAYPELYGDLISIMYDDLNYLESFVKTVINVDSVNYNVYTLNDFLTDIFKLNFNINESNEIINQIPSSNIDGGTF